MNLLAFLTTWAVTIYASLGLYVYKVDPRARLNRLFLVWTLFLAEYSFCYALLYMARTPQSHQLWYHLSALGWGSHESLLLHIALLLMNRDLSLKKGQLLLLYSPGILVTAFELFAAERVARISPVTYLGVWIFEGIYIYSFAFCSIFLVWQWGRKSSFRREKKQARIFVISGIITYLFCFCNETLLPAFNLNILPVMCPLFILILAVSFWYVVVKLKLSGLVTLLKIDDIVDKITDLVFLVDNEGIIVDHNQRVTEILSYAKGELLQLPLERVMGAKAVDVLQQLGSHNIASLNTETFCIRKYGGTIPVRLEASAIFEAAGDQVGVVLVCQDETVITNLQAEISNRRHKEEQLSYISLHDPVTGLFNRTRFEQELRKLETQSCRDAGIMVSDIDGLKLVNDTFGHHAGDQLLVAAARALQQSFPADVIVARIGGDEFAVLIARADRLFIKNVYSSIQKAVAQFNTDNPELHLSLSVGYAIAAGEDRKITDLFKEADDMMYKEKLNNNKSVRNGIIQALMKTLEARDFITEGHTNRIQELLVELGGHMHLSDPIITNLRLLGQFHDIGKVGIPDRILFKPGALTEAEMKIMRQHSDIGYRIAKSIPDLNPIAELIRMHHERWDGHGYPVGLQQETIPLECRILSVVDAFDSMCNNRPYRMALSVKEAITELVRNSGTQFDPVVVDHFLKLVAAKNLAPTGDFMPG